MEAIAGLCHLTDTLEVQRFITHLFYPENKITSEVLHEMQKECSLRFYG
jgi:hypothetical protein